MIFLAKFSKGRYNEKNDKGDFLMAYYIGQALGIVATVCCFSLPLFKKKWQVQMAAITTVIAIVKYRKHDCNY